MKYCTKCGNQLGGNKNTAWIVNSNEAWGPNGIDLLEFKLNANEIDHIMLTNGYAKSQKVFNNNARADSVVISRLPSSATGPADIIYSGPLRDTPEPQYLPVSSRYDNNRPTSKIYVWFPTIINGSKYPNDFV